LVACLADILQASGRFMPFWAMSEKRLISTALLPVERFRPSGLLHG
jgi:hypothetical protein